MQKFDIALQSRNDRTNGSPLALFRRQHTTIRLFRVHIPYSPLFRDVGALAQYGSALDSKPSGRRFKSGKPQFFCRFIVKPTTST